MQGENRTVSLLRKSILRGCHVLPAFIGQDCVMPGVSVDFSKGKTSTNLNGMFKYLGLKGMLDVEDY